jgi:hypothetical protein
MKIRPVGSEMFNAGVRTDRQTDMENLFAILRMGLKKDKCVLEAECVISYC